MHKVQYGNKTIEYTFILNDTLKSHYITVDKGVGVVLKGKAISNELAEKLILKKARWILDKLELVKSIESDEIVTGSRMPYLGRRYYVEIVVNNCLSEININYTASNFKVETPSHLNNQDELLKAFNEFYKHKAFEKIGVRIRRWQKSTGLQFSKFRIMTFEKRWGSCTSDNKISINIDSIKLPYSLIDYILVHELVHTKIKDHSKEFWAEVSKHLPNWKVLDEKMMGMKL